MHLKPVLAALLLSAPAVRADPPSATNAVHFEQAALADVARYLGEAFAVNAVVPEYLSSYEVSLRLDQVDLADIIKAMNLQFRAEAANLGWTAARTRGNRTTYVLEPKPAELTLTSIAAARGPGLTNLLPRLTFRDAPLREVAEHLRKMGCPTLLLPSSLSEVAVSLDLRNVCPPDIVEMLMRLIGEEVYWECQGLQLSSGQWVFALLLKDQEEAKPVEGLVKVYYGGDDTVELRTTQVMLMDLLVTAGLDKKAQVMVHDPSRMIVVRGPQEVQDFVLNAIEEMRRGREAKRAAGTPRPAGPPPPSAPPAAQP
jgi:hypothetical protein